MKNPFTTNLKYGALLAVVLALALFAVALVLRHHDFDG